MAARKKAIENTAASDTHAIIPPDYGEWLASLKSRITLARERAAYAVNHELIRLYHQIGTEILIDRHVRGGEQE